MPTLLSLLLHVWILGYFTSNPQTVSPNLLRATPETCICIGSQHSHARTPLVPDPPCLSKVSCSQPGAFSQTSPHSAALQKPYQLGMQSRLPMTFALSPVVFGNYNLNTLSAGLPESQSRRSAGFLLDTFTPSDPPELFFSMLRALSQVGTHTSHCSRPHMDGHLGPS
jgi:hypothetical protein